jgi:hypothetical protein
VPLELPDDLVRDASPAETGRTETTTIIRADPKQAMRRRGNSIGTIV